MKIAITGHTAGIGKAFAEALQSRGHEIVGLSKRHGWNIRITPKILDAVEPCDLFINNAQAGYAQTELLYGIWQRWHQQPNKHIWCISTMMTQYPTNPPIPDQSDLAINAYRNQKIALEDACHQLQSRPGTPNIVIIRPGGVATQPGQQSPVPYADVTNWVNTVIAATVSAESQQMRIKEMSLAATSFPLEL